MPTLDWTFPVKVAELPKEGSAFELAPDPETRAALAEHAGVLAVPKLVARMTVTPDGRGGAVVEGMLDASVRQTCVVSLDPLAYGVDGLRTALPCESTGEGVIFVIFRGAQA